MTTNNCGTLALLILSVVLLCLPAQANKTTVRLVDHSDQWKLSKIVATNLVMVDNIVYHPSGSLYATLERRYVGQLVQIKPDGKIKRLLFLLQRPDGLLLHGENLYLTEEVKQGRIIRYDLKAQKSTILLKNVLKPEGIDRFADGKLVISEDAGKGNVFTLDKDGKKKVIIPKLQRPEGLCVAADQTLYVAETLTNRILRLRDGKVTSVLSEHIKQPDQVECHKDGSLWISEDQKPGRVFRFSNNTLQVIAKGLSAPQGIAFGAKGEVYIAEQGKHRIIKLVRQPGR